MSTKRAFMAMLAGLSIAPGAMADDEFKNHYHNIEVRRFDLSSGVELPDDFRVTLMEDLVAQLNDTKAFRQVLREGEKAAEPRSPTLRLVGRVTRFSKGSRAKRYLIGPGFGKTILKAEIRFLDAATGEVRFEKTVDGKVIIGFIGGDSMGATRGLAKEVARVAKKQFF